MNDGERTIDNEVNRGRNETSFFGRTLKINKVQRIMRLESDLKSPGIWEQVEGNWKRPNLREGGQEAWTKKPQGGRWRELLQSGPFVQRACLKKLTCHMPRIPPAASSRTSFRPWNLFHCFNFFPILSPISKTLAYLKPPKWSLDNTDTFLRIQQPV